MSTKIICIVGRSGSGKTGVAQALVNRGEHVVCSNTTRAPRIGERNGQAPYYHFVDINSYTKAVTDTGLVFSGNLSRGDDIILADTVYGNNTYWTTISDVLAHTGKQSFYIIDPIGVRSLFSLQQQIKSAIQKFNYSREEAPLLHKFSSAAIHLVYLKGCSEIQKTVIGPSRIARDKEQDLGWDLCEIFAQLRLDNTTQYMPELLPAVFKSFAELLSTEF